MRRALIILLALLCLAQPAVADDVVMVGFGAGGPSVLCTKDNTSGSVTSTTYQSRASGYIYGNEFTCNGVERSFGVYGNGVDTSNYFKVARVDQGGGTYPIRWDTQTTWVMTDGTNSSYTVKYYLTAYSDGAVVLKLYVNEDVGDAGTMTVRISNTDTYDLTSGYCSANTAINGTGEYTLNFTGCDFED